MLAFQTYQTYKKQKNKRLRTQEKNKNREEGKGRAGMARARTLLGLDPFLGSLHQSSPFSEAAFLFPLLTLKNSGSLQQQRTPGRNLLTLNCCCCAGSEAGAVTEILLILRLKGGGAVRRLELTAMAHSKEQKKEEQ